MFLGSRHFLGSGEDIYKPNDMIEMHEQKLHIRVNFRADTLKYIEGWKKKSNFTSSSNKVERSGSSRRSVHSDSTQSNEVEVYFPAKRTQVYANFKSNEKLDGDVYYSVRSHISDKESGRWMIYRNMGTFDI